jgi:hypothetical protein
MRCIPDASETFRDSSGYAFMSFQSECGSTKLSSRAAPNQAGQSVYFLPQRCCDINGRPDHLARRAPRTVDRWEHPV